MRTTFSKDYLCWRCYKKIINMQTGADKGIGGPGGRHQLTRSMSKYPVSVYWYGAGHSCEKQSASRMGQTIT